MFHALTLSAALLAQAPAAAATPAPSSDPAVMAAEAAQTAAAAAQKAAEAAERIANAMAPAAPAAAAPAEAPAKSNWVGSIGAGLTYITGNAETLTLTGNGSLNGTFGQWGLGIKASGAYGLANPSTAANTPPAVTARRASLLVRGDRSFGEGFAQIYAQALGEFDHMKNIESRALGELGAGLTFFNQKEATYEKLYLRVDIGLRAGHETAYQYFPTPAVINPYGAVVLAPRAALTFRWGFNDYVRFSELFEVIPYVLDPYLGRTLLNSTTQLSARLTANLSLTTSLVLNFDSKPPQAAGGVPRKTLDAALTVGIEATF